MRRLVPVLCGGVLAAVLSGCASQTITERHYYEPTETTALKREDGLTVGALKSEVIKTGQATRRASVSSASASNRPPEHVR